MSHSSDEPTNLKQMSKTHEDQTGTNIKPFYETWGACHFEQRTWKFWYTPLESVRYYGTPIQTDKLDRSVWYTSLCVSSSIWKPLILNLPSKMVCLNNKCP